MTTSLLCRKERNFGGRVVCGRFSWFRIWNYEKVSVSLIRRLTAVPIDGLVGIEVACEILNK